MLDTTIAKFGWKQQGATHAHQFLVPVIKRLLPAESNLRILDMGCGNGHIANWLASQHQVIGIDQDADGIALASGDATSARFFRRSVCDDISDITPEHGFDLVICSEVIEHLIAPNKLLQNCYNNTRAGGVLIVTTPLPRLPQKSCDKSRRRLGYAFSRVEGMRTHQILLRINTQ
jgi:2-polyprenyl-3-methyl-5-hydroxy-6-metoxy-1,4-benzoquinol methylase